VKNWVLVPLEWIAFTIAAILAIGGTTFVLVLVVGPLVLPIVLIIVSMFLLLMGPAIARWRTRRALLLVDYLQQAVVLNLPLPQFLFALEQAETRAMRQRLSRLGHALYDGVPLGDALRNAAPEVSARIVGALNAAERNGRLRETLAELQSDRSDGDEPSRQRLSGQTVYAAVVPIVVVVVVMMLSIFVLPKFEMILRDFAIPQPAATVWLIWLARVTWFVWLLAVPLLVVVLLLAAGRAMRQLFRSTPLPPVAPNLRARCRWQLPIFGRVEQENGLAQSMLHISQGLRSGRTLPASIASAASNLSLNPVLGDQLHGWASRLVAGESTADAARQSGLPPLLYGLLVGQSAETLIPAMEFLHRHYASRVNRLRTLLLAAVGPAMSLIFGAITLLVALTVFQPLQLMLENLARSPWQP
jgi:type IV pilus assembly protein PilC